MAHTAADPSAAFPTTTLNSSADTTEAAARRMVAIENIMVELYPWEVQLKSCRDEVVKRVKGV